MTSPRIHQPSPDAMASLRAQGLLEEAERRRARTSFVEEVCFDKQIAFIRDRSKRKWVFTPRRSGKSNGFGILLLNAALSYPGRDSLYLGLTGLSAERTIYKHIIERETKRLKIRTSYNRTTRILTFANNSTIQIAGMDASPQQMDRILGSKFHLACIDECQSTQQDIEHMVEEKLGPAMEDYALDEDGGVICLGGTPGDHMGKHFWFQLTQPEHDKRVQGWSGHSWSTSDNPHMRLQFAALCAQRAKENPHFMEDPSFRRQWLGEWVTDSGTRVYKYDANRNAQPSAEVRRELLSASPRWQYVVGVDLGWEDATAIVVAAFSLTDPHFYVVESKKIERETFDSVGARLLALQSKYKPKQMACDMVGGGKQLSMSLREKFKLPLVMAEKIEKQHHIARMNSDFLSGSIQVIPDLNVDLATEWGQLQVDRRSLEKGEWKEGEKWDNHLADAALYAWRFSLHHRAIVPALHVPDAADRALEIRARMRPPPAFRERSLLDVIDEQRSARDVVRRYRGSREHV